MPLTSQAQGVVAIAVTPFHTDGRLDGESVDRMVDFYLGCGVTGLTILGIMGEAPKLEMSQSLAFIKQVVARAGQTPVVVGVSSPGFAGMRFLARGAMDLGAAGVMIAPQPSLRTDEQIITYFGQAVEAIGSDVPWVLQDTPLPLGVITS